MSYFNVSYRRCMPRTLAWRPAGIGNACQSGNMAMLLTSSVVLVLLLLLLNTGRTLHRYHACSLLFVVKISFLPKYRVKYYDYIIQWCFVI